MKLEETQNLVRKWRKRHRLMSVTEHYALKSHPSVVSVLLPTGKMKSLF
jgi:hypothetical protein